MTVLAACASEPPPASCVPGQTIACACPGGVSGVQRCLPDRTFDVCACPVADAGVSDASIVDAPTVDAPAVDAPAVDVPAVDAPTIDAPADGPAVDASGIDGGDASTTDVVDVTTRDAPVAMDLGTDLGGADLPALDVASGVDAARTDGSMTADAEACPAVTVGPAGGTVSCAGASVAVPANALASPVPLQIVPTGMPAPAGYAAYSPVFRFEPAGTTFALPVRVSLPFTGDAARATLFWSRPASDTGHARIGGLASGGVVTASVSHFSTGFVADGVDFAEAPDRRCTITRLLEGRTVAPSGVAMFFTAEDCQGRPLTDLRGGDFVVREDGTPLSSEASATLITRVGPRVFVSLVLDVSASTQAFLPQLTAAAAELVTNLQTVRRLPVQIGLQVFAGESNLTEWQAPTLDTAQLLARLTALAGYRPADPSSTNLFGATIQAITRQTAAETAFRTRNAGGAFTRGYVVLFTDGGDTAGLRSQGDALAAVRGTTDRVLAVGLAGGDFMPSVLSALATGGVLTAPDASTLTREFSALASRIAAEFRTLYLLGYCSARRAGDHTVTVSVAGGTTMPVASYDFSAAAFGPGCSGATFTDACAPADQCGGLGCGACDDRTAQCNGATRRCVDHCVTANRCGGEVFTNPLGYAQTCTDRLGATACGGACRDTRTDTNHCGRCNNACAAETSCVDGACEARPPRALAPLSTSVVTSQQPTLRWVVGANTEATRVTLCRDRAMTRGCLAPLDVTGPSGRPVAPLLPGVWFWRAEGLRGGGVVTPPSAVWQFTVGARSAPRDAAWGVTPDLNGDGYADVVVGSSERAWFHSGGVMGVASTPSSVAVPVAGSVTAAGDLNGDGFGDLAVGALLGRSLSVYLSGPAGPAGAPLTRVPSFSTISAGGVGALGDLNLDGYGDVALGPYVYLGSATGPANSFVTLRDPSSRDWLTGTATGVGDVNGDGRNDVMFCGTQGPGAATVHLYLGGTTGLGPASPALAVPSGATGFGASIVAAGDVNGDGLADVLITAPQASRVYVYFGDPGGLGTSPVLLSGYSQGFFGSGVSEAGDLNGDGFADVAVGSSQLNAVTVYPGRASGFGASPTTIMAPGGGSFGSFLSGLGDVDGDGFDDLAVCAIERSAVYVYRGGASGPAETPATTLTGAPNTSYGGSVARVRGARAHVGK
ncbi:MAG: FG-GAP-like repeat-containing protein [Polyangiales bacterium]